MKDPHIFGENLVRFNEVADRLEDGTDMRRFYHELIVACAGRMKTGTFLQALHEAEEKISR
jgi:GTP1/Obg family GTP-binding protein